MEAASFKGFSEQGWQHTSSPENALLSLATGSTTLFFFFLLSQTSSSILEGFKNNKCLTGVLTEPELLKEGGRMELSSVG